MDRALLCFCWVLVPLMAAGCVGQPHGTSADTPNRQVRRKQAPSREAAFVLRNLGHVDETGNVRTTDHYDEARLDRLEWELFKVGARLEPDGKLHDRNGREVYVWEEGRGYGCRVEEERLRREAEERQQRLRELRKRYTVIELPYFGMPPC